MKTYTFKKSATHRTINGCEGVYFITPNVENQFSDIEQFIKLEVH